MSTSVESSEPQAPVRHDTYYMEDGTHILQVEHVLYKVHDDLLIIHSDLFGDMYSIGDASTPVECSLEHDEKEGNGDENPIILHGERADVFNFFLDFVYGRERRELHAYSKGELRDMLSFVDKFRCSDMRDFVLDHVWNARSMFHPAELLQLSVAFKLRRLFKWSFRRLVDMPLVGIAREHRDLMSDNVFVAITRAKAAVNQHLRLVANQEPRILLHADDCQDAKACETDWAAVWWNGMGRFLLDGRNPLPVEEALRRFKKMRFGRMGDGCKLLMFKVLDGGHNFKYVEPFVTDVCRCLIEEMHINE